MYLFVCFKANHCSIVEERFPSLPRGSIQKKFYWHRNPNYSSLKTNFSWRERFLLHDWLNDFLPLSAPLTEKALFFRVFQASEGKRKARAERETRARGMVIRRRKRSITCPQVQKILRNICFSEQTFQRKQSLAAPETSPA